MRWASKKAAGSTRNGRKSAGRRLGIKSGDGECIELASTLCCVSSVL